MPGLFDGTPLERPITCERCSRELSVCQCPTDATCNPTRPADQHPRVRREKRRGKWSTVITGLDQDAAEQKVLLKQLRTALGTGGGITTINDRGTTEHALVLQGDHKEAALDHLTSLGYNAKPAGG